MLSSRWKIGLIGLYTLGLLLLLIYIPWSATYGGSLHNDGHNWLWAMHGSVLFHNWGAESLQYSTFTPDYRYILIEISAWSMFFLTGWSGSILATSVLGKKSHNSLVQQPQ